MTTAGSAALGGSPTSWTRWTDAFSALSFGQKVLATVFGVSGAAVLGSFGVAAAFGTRKLWGPFALAGLGFWAGTKFCAGGTEEQPPPPRPEIIDAEFVVS
ncbi:MAG: hypothetical protein ACKVPX_13795 [Myxococcaceae bacterium]